MRHAATDLVKGAVAGAAAAWAMNRVTTLLYERESRAAQERENRARGGKTAMGVAAERTARLANEELGEAGRKQGATALHWAMLITAGALYGVLRHRVPALGRAAGAPFGAAWWLAVDEVANVALGFTPGPRAFPWQTHARGLAGHLVFAAAADGTLRVLDRVRVA